MRRLLLPGLLLLLAPALPAQAPVVFQAHADQNIGPLSPLWRDHWDVHMVYGYGGNFFCDPVGRTPYVQDAGFDFFHQTLKPRSLRVSIGAFNNVPASAYNSTEPAVLAALATEFYRGPNDLAAADDPAHYDFTYLDAVLDVVEQTGAEAFLNLDVMPLTLAAADSAHNPCYLPLLWGTAAWDNGVRNGPAATPAVYGRVARNVARHVRGKFKGTKDWGVRYIEIWNEPEPLLIPLLPPVPYFWRGNAQQLYDLYAAAAAEIDNDPEIKNLVKIGCCSFAFRPGTADYPNTFLKQVSEQQTRLDFFSFHPYGDNTTNLAPIRIMMDTADALVQRYNLAGVEMVNAEWGVLANFPDHADYGIHYAQAIIEFLDRGYRFAHKAPLADIAPGNNDQPSLLQIAPFRADKANAKAYLGLNRLNGAAHRLAATAPPGGHLLAAASVNQDTLWALLPVLPATTTGPALVQVLGLPWNGADYRFRRWEFSQGIWQTSGDWQIAAQGIRAGPIFADTVAPGAEGKMFLWELTVLPSGIAELATGSLRIYPNPGAEVFWIEWPETRATPTNVRLFDLFGRMYPVELQPGPNRLELRADLLPGMYLLEIEQGQTRFSGKVIVTHQWR